MSDDAERVCAGLSDGELAALGIHIPLRDYVEKVIASVFRRQPDMSGDPRKRLLTHELRAVEGCAETLMPLFAAHLAPAMAADRSAEAEGVAVVICIFCAEQTSVADNRCWVSSSFKPWGICEDCVATTVAAIFESRTADATRAHLAGHPKGK